MLLAIGLGFALELQLALQADHRTATGERRQVELADGSRLTLNSECAVSLDFSANHRRVRLLAGEAYFDVARISGRPFEVVGADASARVLGTAFAVRESDGGTVVTVRHGQVRVAGADAGRVTLAGGQRIAAAEGRLGAWRAAAQRAYPEAELQWLEAPLYPAASAKVLIDRPDQDAVWVYVDPTTAEVRGAHSYFTVQRFFRSFHMNLFLPAVVGVPVGLYVVCAFALSMLTSLVAALVFYRRWWRRFFAWPRGRGRAFWSGLHKTAGVWSIWFLVAIGLTGAWYL